MSLVQHILKENDTAVIDSPFDELISKIESSLSVDIMESDELEYINHGDEAHIYEILNKNKVIRLEQYPDFNQFESLIGKTYPNIVEIYYSNIINDVLITVMEKLEPLNSIEYDKLNQLDLLFGIDNLAYAYDFNNYSEDELTKWLENSRDFKKGFIHRKTIWDIIDITNDIHDIMADIRRGLYILMDLNIDQNDLHVGNIMKDPKTKEIKLIDFGR